MKKLVLGAIALLMFSFQGQCKNIVSPYSIVPSNNLNLIGVGIHFSIIRGLRSSADCEGKGWCRIDIEITIDAVAAQNTYFGTSVGGHLSIALTEQNIRAIREFNGRDAIIFEEDCELPNEMVALLKLTSNIIKKGVYPIKYNSNTRQNEILF